MKCERCGNEHDGSYGKGRFCTEKCCRGFSTDKKRIEINRKVAEKLRGKPFSGTRNDTSWTSERRIQTIQSLQKTHLKRYLTSEFESLGGVGKRARILHEQGGKCLCGQDGVWNGKPLVFHLDHIDGDQNNNKRENNRMLCPNCHSQTPTYAGRNISPEGRKRQSEAAKRWRVQ